MDARVNKVRRQKSANSVLRNKFEAAWLNLLADFKRTDTFKHAQTMGNEREVPVRMLITDNLPGSYSAVGGEIVDLSNRASGQIDVIVYNAQRNSAFISGGSYILPAEAPLVTIEVKSQLTRAEVKRSLVSASKLKALKPLGRALGAPRADGQPFDGRFRYLHCIFAYNTDLVPGSWSESENTRLSECCSELGLKNSLIDRIYVADRGMLIPSKEIYLPESSATGFALLHFILHVRGFCLREDARRPSVDYVNYASAASHLWQPCKIS